MSEMCYPDCRCPNCQRIQSLEGALYNARNALRQSGFARDHSLIRLIDSRLSAEMMTRIREECEIYYEDSDSITDKDPPTPKTSRPPSCICRMPDGGDCQYRGNAPLDMPFQPVNRCGWRGYCKWQQKHAEATPLWAKINGVWGAVKPKPKKGKKK